MHALNMVPSSVQDPMLGVFTYSSAKASRLALASKPRGVAYIFVMHVLEVLEKWPEADKRTRSWVRHFSTRTLIRHTPLPGREAPAAFGRHELCVLRHSSNFAGVEVPGFMCVLLAVVQLPAAQAFMTSDVTWS